MALNSATHGGDSSDNGNAKTLKSKFGNYCYLFPDLAKEEASKPPFGASDRDYFQALNDFGPMITAYGTGRSSCSNIPAVYTYFGQFINHDMSAAVGIKGDFNFGQGQVHLPGGAVIVSNPNLVPLTSPNREGSPESTINSLANEHAFPLSLNSLYGDGPGTTPNDFYDVDRASFTLKDTVPDPQIDDSLRKLINNKGKSTKDVPRDANKNIALIFDQRNDGNLIISQLHLAFMLFHNSAVAALKKQSSALNGKMLFDKARELVTKHYQWCILHDYLEHVAPGKLAATRGLIAQPKSVPLEMSTAAFRFGHSMVSSVYDYNEVFGLDNGCRPATLKDLFVFTSPQKMAGRSDLIQLPNHWIIDWKRLLAERPKKTMAERIDTLVAGEMADLSTLGILHPSKDDLHLYQIVARNLQRGFHRFIPSGQGLCKRIFGADYKSHALDGDKIRSCFPAMSGNMASWLADNKFGGTTPAWLYFLCEAQYFEQGNSLGPTAAAIVTQTIEGLIRNAPVSCLSGNWKPEDSPLRYQKAAIKDIKGILQFAGAMV